MTPDEVRRLMGRYASTWRYLPPPAEVDEWIRALERHPESAVSRALDQCADEGVDRPRIVDITRRLREPPRPQLAPKPPQWDGPTDKGRALIRGIRENLARVPPTEELWRKRRDDDL